MNTRQKALRFLEKIKRLQESNGVEFDTCVYAIAMQSAIFEKIEPRLWDFALADAREGMNLAMPEKTN